MKAIKCSGCGFDVDIGNAFCPRCGTKIEVESTLAQDVDLEWIAAVFRDAGASTEMGATGVIVSLGDNPKVVLAKINEMSILTMQVMWSLKKVGFGNKSAFMTAVNKANQINWICTFYFSDDFKSLSCSESMYLSKSTTRQEVVAFVTNFLSLASSAVVKSDLIAFG